jgi:hypothetical protein
MAKMTMSFAAWKEGRVVPATIAIPVADAKAEKKTTKR